MNLPDYTLSPPKRLALAYSAKPFRRLLEVILGFDDRLASVVLHASEPLIAQIRLAWWSDVISKPVSERPIGEPFLSLLGEIEREYPEAVLQQTLIMLIDVWGILLAHDDWSSSVLQEFADVRAKTIFGSYAFAVGGDDREAVKAGIYWALADLHNQVRAEEERQNIAKILVTKLKPSRLAHTLRPLEILVRSAILESEGGKASPWRMLRFALTGY
jgi:15-cis-phytoene synthase